MFAIDLITLIVSIFHSAQSPPSNTGFNSGYTVIAKVDIPYCHNKTKEQCKIIMADFGQKNPGYMLDSSMVNKYFTKGYFGADDSAHVFYSGRLYPLFPVLNWARLHSYYIKAPKSNLVYVLGLYYDGFAISDICFMDSANTRLDCFNEYRIQSMGKDAGIEFRRKNMVHFNEHILPALKSYFPE